MLLSFIHETTPAPRAGTDVWDFGRLFTERVVSHPDLVDHVPVRARASLEPMLLGLHSHAPLHRRGHGRGTGFPADSLPRLAGSRSCWQQQQQQFTTSTTTAPLIPPQPVIPQQPPLALLKNVHCNDNII